MPTVMPTIPEVFVIWHPACPFGETLARRIYQWLRPGNGLGPEVFYRSLPAPEAPPGGLPPPLPGEHRPGGPPAPAAPAGSQPRRLQIAILLIDDNMIADAGWRHWLNTLVLTPGTGTRELLPVALDSTAYNVPERLRDLNFLRPTGDPKTDLEGVARSLLKQLTETLTRLLLSRSAAHAGVAGDAPKLTIFLSHAKADGVHPARRIRDYIYGKTQLAAFYDENDIPYGSGFSRVLEGALQGADTAALIAVRSTRYASRPWCRREISLFRRPRQEAPGVGLAGRWQLSPVVVVDALESGAHSGGIPEFGNAPLIRWSDEVADQEEHIVTTVLRDALLAAFHRGLGRTMPDEADCVILNWVPDPTTLLHIPRIRSATEQLRVFYPGRGLTGLELEILDESFPQLTFRSFDQAES